MSDRNGIPRAVRLAVGAGHLTLGVGLALVVLLVLPARYLPVDVPLGLLALLFGTAGGALLGGVRPGALLARVASAVGLVVGLAFLTILIWTASYIQGLYLDLGRWAAVGFVLLAITVLPYLVIYPGVTLVVLRPPREETAPAPAESRGAA